MLQGIPVSPGIAVGRAVVVRFGGTPAFRKAIPPDQMEAEERRFRKAAHAATEDFLAQSKQSSGGDMGSELAAILEAHGMIASDESLLGPVVERMRKDRVNAEWALAAVSRELAARLEASAVATMRERAADITDVAREISRHLSGGHPLQQRELPRGSILVADELSPADTARLDPRRSARSLWSAEARPLREHHRPLLRAAGGAGVPGLCDAVSPERPIVVDGDRGVVDAAPSKGSLRRSLVKIREAQERTRRLHARTAGAAVTADGIRIVLRANIELAEEVPALDYWHAEGIGLFRSEFLYLKAAPRTPSVEEQREAYEMLLAAVGPHPVTVRTYDLGGEKGIGPVTDENPALGLRGLRYCLATRSSSRSS
jgi:phosphotransferase system enzyme I (PtsI)